MHTHRPIIALVTLLAVAAGPAMAATAPCCCTKPVEQPKACCQSAEHVAAQPAIALKPCCAKQQLASPSVGRRSCCCVESTPAVPTSRDDATAKRTVREATFAVTPDSIGTLSPVFAANCVEITSQPPPLSGPSLLALYCIWLK